MAAMDTDEDEYLRVLSMLTEETATATIASVKINGAELNPLQAAKLRLFFAAAWHVRRGGDQEAEQETVVNPPPVLTRNGLCLDMPDVIALNGVIA